MAYRQVLEGKHNIHWEKKDDAGDEDAPRTDAPDDARERDELKDAYPAIHKPMDAGLMLSPPNSTDVDQTSGRRVPVIISSSEIMP